MLTINKRDIANVLLLNKLAEIKIIEEKIKFFERKYKSDFKTFLKKMQSSKTENFEEWDDSMEWEALNKVYNELTDKIRALKGGRFRVA